MPSPKLAKPRNTLQDLRPSYFPSSPPPHLYSIKENGIQTLIRWYSRTLVCHLLKYLKIIPFLNTSSLPIIGLLGSEQTELGFGNTCSINLIYVLMGFPA